MRRRFLPIALRSVRTVAVSLASLLALAAPVNAALFGTWTPAGDLGGPDSDWVAYSLGLSTDDGSNVAAIDVTLRGTFHQRWTSFVEGDPFEPTPSGAARNFDSHLTPIASALIVNLNEDNNPNSSDAATPLLPGTARTQSGIGTTLSGVWGIPGADQTPSLDFAYIVVPRNADLSQFQFDIDASTHNSGVFNTYGLHGCSLFSAGCNFNLTSTFNPAAPTPPPAQDPPPATPPIVAPPESPVVPPLVIDVPSPAPRDPQPEPVEPPLFFLPPDDGPTNWIPNIGQYTSEYFINVGDFLPVVPVEHDWSNGYTGDEYFTRLIWSSRFDDWDGRFTTFLAFDGETTLMPGNLVTGFHGTAVMSMVIDSSLNFFSSAGSDAYFYGSAAADASNANAAPEPTTATLVVLASAGFGAVTRRRAQYRNWL